MRIPGRPAVLVAVLLGFAPGCATRVESPREPYVAIGKGSKPEMAADRQAFDVLQSWHWPATLEVPQRERFGRDPLNSGTLGLWRASEFRLADGRCRDSRASEAVLCYFRDEVIAVPGHSAAVEEPSAVAGDGSDHTIAAGGAPLPMAVWIGAPEVIESARLSADGKTLSVPDRQIPLALMPRNPTNLAYPDAATATFFADRSLRVRGATRKDGAFVARTIWPEDARIDAPPRAEPLAERETLGTLVEAQGSDGARGDFPVRLLFDAGRARNWEGMSAFAIVLSGAQSDDDGARAGHIGVATGLLGPDGEWRDWIVNNFYPLQERGPKGIISAAVPMDNYLLDFNSGQLYYRPAYMLAVILRRPAAAREIQAAMQRTMLAYYCRDIQFDTARNNSTAMSLDTLRAIGWRIPPAGPTSRVLGLLGAPVAAVARFSFTSGRNFFSTMTAETTRLLPRVAFEVAGHDLLYLVRDGSPEGELTPFERRLVEDVEAVLFVRLPQVATSRPVGTFPERSLLTYGARMLTQPKGFEQAQGSEARSLPQDLEETCEQPSSARADGR